jgi:hypothetical protein
MAAPRRGARDRAGGAPEGGMSPADVFTPMQLQAIEQLVEQKLQARGAAVATSPAPPELISPEEASRRLGGRPSADTIRGLIHRGLIPKRLVGEGKERMSYLVTIDEVLAALVATGKPALAPGAPVDLEAARARARERAGKPRGGR